MSYLQTYAQVFLVGGLICLLGQILIIKTNVTSARILVFFVSVGAILEAAGLYEPIVRFGKAGALVPITGFGSALAKGAITGVKEHGFLGAFSGGLAAISAGVVAAVIFAFVYGLIFRSKTKKLGRKTKKSS